MKIMQKLTIKNLLMNKARTLVTIIGILLSAALITLIAGMASSLQQTAVNYSVQASGDYIVNFYGDMTKINLDDYVQNRNVKNVYTTATVGVAENEYSKYESMPYIVVKSVSEGGFENCFNGRLKEGRYPKNSNEIVLSKDFVSGTTKEYKVGDTLKLNLGYTCVTTTEYYIDETSEMSDNAEKNAETKTYCMPLDSPYAGEDTEFMPYIEKTYTIVGILDNVSRSIGTYQYNSGFTYIYTAYDGNINEIVPQPGLDNEDEHAYNLAIFLQFTPEGELNYKNVIADILGVDDAIAVSQYINHSLTSVNQTDIYDALARNNLYGFEVNQSILHTKMIELSLEEAFMIVSALVIIFGIVIISSIFIIRNSFYISITEKSKLYGMLASTGATPSQIRNNVFFEGFLLGIVGIPLGILLGIAGTMGLVQLCNTTLEGVLAGVQMIFSVSWQAVAMAFVLCAGTIFMSVLSPSIETSRISPIVAIRGNQDIKISKKNRKKEKSYKTPKFIQKRFGIGGSIAWKNLQRSKKRYRATVISITASVTVYLAISTVVGCLVSYMDNQFSGMKYNISVYIDDDLDTKENVRKSLDKYYKFANGEDISESTYSASIPNIAALDFPANMLSEYEVDSFIEEQREKDNILIPYMSVEAIDNKTFDEFAKKLGSSYEKLKGKAIIFDKVKSQEQKFDENGNYAGYEYVHRPVFKDMVGYTFKLQDHIAYMYEHPYEDENDEEYDEYYNQEEYEKEKKEYLEKNGKIFEIEIGAAVTPENMALFREYKDMNGNIIADGGVIIYVSEDWLVENANINENIWICYDINSSDPQQTEIRLDEMGVQKNDINNIAQYVAQINSISFIMQFFVYSFIGIITLIGLTNVFNTINTNMNLRKKEFASLRSIGMTNSEFDRMITLESFFYSFKSLAIGIPLGLGIGVGGYFWLHSMSNGVVKYSFPIMPLLLAIGAVGLLVWLIMTVSIRKVRNQNVIETIRNDNI